ncbi:replicative DNA helicase [Flavobacterium nackdongense]|uniref:SF4 helicase domain-containing protein n=1 Tax=Flavobacterium nackdongense TaxID=2547394 RepID=A0A4P6Y9S3_9FLAO|nr:DnaB-like helicase C-terminal domain-containing protein [Flavobacterium nackdongense]QBN19759.1 hypothetical protein E1750_13415 [Flavobacterium nackdongense]
MKINNPSTSINSLFENLIQNIESKEENKNIIPTLFSLLDQKFGGISLGELIVIGGRPSMGKTQFAVNLVSNICQQNPVLYFSFDLLPKDLTARFVSCRTNIPVNKIINRQLMGEEIEKIKSVTKDFKNSSVFISDVSSIVIENILAEIHSYVTNYGVRVVVIDYLQLMGSSKINFGREAEIGHICKVLKNCAKELNISLILLSGLSRSVELRGSSKKPQLIDLRESGSIEQLADKVWLLYRPEYYLIDELDDDCGTPSDCILTLIVAKNKNGINGECYFKRNINFTEFKNIEEPSNDFELLPSRLREIEKPFEKFSDDDAPF